MKKLLAQIALAIFINLLMIPMSMAADVSELANPYSDVEPCIKEFNIGDDGIIKPGPEGQGPDYGYIIYISQEPLSSGVAEGKTPDDKYVVRPCFQNSFSFSDPTNTSNSKNTPMLANQCSANAQTLYNSWTVEGDADKKKYSVTYSCKEVKVTLTKGGTTAIYGYIGDIYKWGASIVGIVATTVIIVSGIQISAAGGEPEAIGAAKKRILQSIAGIVVLFLSGLILYTVNPTFFTK